MIGDRQGEKTMTDNERNIISAVLQTIPEARGRIAEILDMIEHPATDKDRQNKNSLNDRGRLLSQVEVAEIMHRTPTTIRNWTRQKKLLPARLPGATKVAGYFEEDVRRLKDSLCESA